MLTGNEIMQRMAKGNIIIYPFNEKQLNPNSYNLKLGTRMKTYRNVILDMKKPLMHFFSVLFFITLKN